LRCPEHGLQLRDARRDLHAAPVDFLRLQFAQVKRVGFKLGDPQLRHVGANEGEGRQIGHPNQARKRITNGSDISGCGGRM
jgi:hypothetical protein